MWEALTALPAGAGANCKASLYVTQLWAGHHFPHCIDEETEARELKNSTHVWGTGSIWELCVPSAQFCKPKTALKNIKNIF